MSKPTLREAVECVEVCPDDYPGSAVLAEAILKTAELYALCGATVETYNAATDGPYSRGRFDEAKRVRALLKEIGIDTLVEPPKKDAPKFPQGPYWPVVPRDNITGSVRTVQVRLRQQGERPAQIKYDPDKDW